MTNMKSIHYEVKKIVDRNKGIRRASILIGVPKDSIKKVLSKDFLTLPEGHLSIITEYLSI